jgi:hypothetical protein
LRTFFFRNKSQKTYGLQFWKIRRTETLEPSRSSLSSVKEDLQQKATKKTNGLTTMSLPRSESRLQAACSDEQDFPNRVNAACPP